MNSLATSSLARDLAILMLSPLIVPRLDTFPSLVLVTLIKFGD